MSPTRRLNCSTCPLTPARMTVFARSASAWASAASALAFSAGRRRGDLRLGTLFSGCGRRNRAFAALDGDLKLLDIPARHNARVAPLQLLFGLQFINGLLVGALGLLDLAFRLHDVRARDHH